MADGWTDCTAALISVRFSLISDKATLITHLLHFYTALLLDRVHYRAEELS